MMWLVPLLFTTLVAIEVDVYADKEKQLEKRHLSLEPNEFFVFKVYGDNIHLRLLENTIDCDYAELLLVAKEHVYGPFCNKKRKRRTSLTVKSFLVKVILGEICISIKK